MEKKTQEGTIPVMGVKAINTQRLISLKKYISLIFNLNPITLSWISKQTPKYESQESNKHSFYNTLYLIKEFAFFVYTGMLYSLCILQGYKTSFILNITPKVISGKKSFYETKLDFKKNHMDKQLSNKIGLIRFLSYLTTWQISCPQSPSSKNLMWKPNYR